MQFSRVLLSLAVLVPGLLAQTTTVKATIPDGLLKKEASGSHWAVWSVNNARAQYLYPQTAIGSSVPKTLRGFRIRPDGTWWSGVKKSVRIEIAMSSLGVKVGNANPKAWTNHGTDLQVIFKRKTVLFPPYKKPVKPPLPWMLDFKLDRPFLRKGKNLAVDIKGFVSKGWEQKIWYADCVRTAPDWGASTPYGSGCPTSFTQGALIGSYHVGASWPFRTVGSTLASGDLVVSWVGSAKTSILLTGTSCRLYTLPLLSHPLPALSSTWRGTVTFHWGRIPASLGGKSLYFQMAALRKSRLLLSRGLGIRFGTGGFETGVTIYGSSTNLSRPRFDPDKAAPQNVAFVIPVLGVY